MRRVFLLLIEILLLKNSIAQPFPEDKGFIPPVDFQIYLSGSFAELRSDHFHSGIDIKTQGVIGKKIYAIGDGYVSRIKVQTNGYGKSVYINHPEGYTSVYGHLSEYNQEISDYVKRYQYKNKTHTLDIYPAKNELTVKKGEILALSGNSGSSSGPHLHFEIRNVSNQHPLNVQKFGFPVSDNVDPRIFNFYVYSFEGKDKRRTIISRRKEGLYLQNRTYYLKRGDTLNVSTPVSFGMEVFDFLNGVRNRCGIYYIKMYSDGELIYHFQADEFSFSESRYINAHIDYKIKKLDNEKVHCLFRKPNNKLSMYPYLKDDGIINIKDYEVREIKIDFADISGNIRSVHFYLKNETADNSMLMNEKEKAKLFKWDIQNEYNNHMFKINIPAGSLYEDTEFSYTRTNRKDSMHPYLHELHSREAALHLPAIISVRPEGIPSEYLKKACLVSFNEKNEPEYEGGEIDNNNNWITLRTRSLGTYTIEIDTLSPQIIPVNFRKGADLTNERELKLIIRDNLSGIESYEGLIDNQWALFEYDPKNDLLVYKFDEAYLVRGKTHELEIYVRDKKGNIAVLQSNFSW